MKNLSSFMLVLLVILIILGAFGVHSYVSEMSPAWRERSRALTALEVQDQQNAIYEARIRRADFTEALHAGLWVVMALITATGGVLLWKQYDMRQESWNRAVDGMFATRTITANGRTVVLDNNKSAFGAIGFDRMSGKVLTDEEIIGPDRQLAYVNNVQRTRSVAAKQIPERPNRTTALADAGFFDAKTREAEARAQLVERRLLDQRQPEQIAPPSRQLPMWTAKDAIKHNTDTTFALGLNDDNEIISWDVESTPHVRVHGKTQGSGKTNLIKEIAVGAVRSGAHVIVLDRRGFKDWSAFAPFVELVDSRVQGAFYGTVKRLQDIYQERDSLLGSAGVGNLAGLSDAPRRIFCIISEFGSACRDALANGELERIVPILKNILSEAGAPGVHMVFEDQAINRNWPPELRGNAEPITGYLPEDASKAGGYRLAFELERYQFHYDGERFKTFDMTVEAPTLLFDCQTLPESEYLIDTASFGVRSVNNISSGEEKRELFGFNERTNTKRTSTDLQALVFEWRLVNPDGTQADLRKEFVERGIDISRGYVHECWHQWNNQQMKGM